MSKADREYRELRRKVKRELPEFRRERERQRRQRIRDLYPSLIKRPG